MYSNWLQARLRLCFLRLCYYVNASLSLLLVPIAPDEDCDSDPCDPNAICTELPGAGNFNCTCIPPFEGDGFMCSK